MYLEKLELQGFKSFAQKTVLEFPKRRGSNPGITSIVGPNGSGKSNTADAVRWVLGEQSLKLLRGKRAEDVIFSGSASKARLGFAEVSLYLNNKDKKPAHRGGGANIEYDQVVVKRRVYRNGESEYHINNSKVRLADIQLLLAQANFGQRTYSVIGQGMTDAILSSTPYERKNFFDEATGVKQYQIKREHAKSKIKTTEENLTQVKSLIREIKPRLKNLEQQIEKREKRKHLEKELHHLQLKHYGSLWHTTNTKLYKLRDKKKTIEKTHLSLNKKLSELQGKIQKLEQEQKHAQIGDYDKVQSGYHEALAKKNELTGALAGFTRELEVLSRLEKAHPTNIDTEKLVESAHKQIDLLESINKITTLIELAELQSKSKKLKSEIKDILKDKDSVPRVTTTEKIHDLSKKIESLKQELEIATKEVDKKQNLVTDLRRVESKATSVVFDTQKKYQSLQLELNEISSQKHHIDVELAKIETTKHNLGQEIEREVHGELKDKIKNANAGEEAQDKWPRIATIKSELEMIGGIEPETDEDYSETKKKYDFLTEQLDDLEDALKKTNQALHQLDEVIEKQFNKSFEKIEKGFTEYFKILFSGGTASLTLNKQTELEMLNEDVAAGLTKKEQEHLANQIKMGIEIKASPPGKKVATISMLSGGERALTSIALICAIIRANPSPFVVLDEVDAALDEANSERFAAILEKLSRVTQFIAITHNRATMEQANILYGVTMGEDGVSKLLSIDLEKAVESIS
jgi:chromosome segregation protein